MLATFILFDKKMSNDHVSSIVTKVTEGVAQSGRDENLWNQN